MYLYLYLKSLLDNLVENEEGQDLIEYALIIVLIVIAAIVGMTAVGTKISTIWGQIVAAL